MNEREEERYCTFSPKPDWRLDGDRKTTGKPSVIQNFSLTSKKIFAKMTGEGKTSGLQRVSKKFSLTSNS